MEDFFDRPFINLNTKMYKAHLYLKDVFRLYVGLHSFVSEDGSLIYNNRSLSIQDLVSYCSLSEKTVTKKLNKIISYGLLSLDPETKVLYACPSCMYYGSNDEEKDQEIFQISYINYCEALNKYIQKYPKKKEKIFKNITDIGNIIEISLLENILKCSKEIDI